MLVTGFQLANKRTGKRYTMLLTDTGVTISHLGLVASDGGTKKETLEKGKLTIKQIAEDQLSDSFDALDRIYTAKFDNGGYTAAYFIAGEGVNVGDHPVLNEEAGLEIVRTFFDKASTLNMPGISIHLGAIPPNLGTYRTDIESFVEKNFADANPTSGKSATPRKPRVNKPQKKLFTDIEAKVLRPNGEEYWPREIMGHTDVSLLRGFKDNNILVRLAGPPGAGKTALAEAAFHSYGNGIITVSGHGDMTVANFVGSFIPRPHRAEGESEWMWVDGPLTRAMKEGCTLFVDEGTRIPTEVLNILFSATDGRNILRIDDRPDIPPVHGKEGFYVILGYNPDTLGARGLDEALISRFSVQINVFTDLETARQIGVPKVAIDIAARMKELSDIDLNNGGDGIWIPQMRELIKFRDIVNMGVGEDFAISNLIASCPREDHHDVLIQAIKEKSKVHKDSLRLPELGRMI